MKLTYLLLLISFLCQGQRVDAISQAIAIARDSEDMDVDIFFNQPRYAPGDTILFKANFSKGLNLKNRNIYSHISLVSIDGLGVISTTVKLNKEGGSNFLAVPKDFSSGLYDFVATAIDGNDDQKIIFKSSLMIVGRSIPVSIPKIATEGGHFILGEKNKVYLNTNGVKYDSILIMNTENGSKTMLKPGNQGYLLEMTPNSSETYSASIMYKGEKREIQLPEVESKSPTATLLSASYSSVEVEMKGYLDSVYFIALVNSAGLQAIKQVDHSRRSITLNGQFNNGSYQVVLLDKNLNVLSSRIFSIQEVEPCSIDIVTEKYVLHPREVCQIKLSIKTPVDNDFINPSVKEGETFVRIYNAKLGEGYSIEDGFYNKNIGSVKVNDQLIGSKVNYFDKKMFSQPSNQKFSSFLIISGRVYLKGTREPAPDSTRVYALFQNTMMNFDVVSRNGKFNVLMAYDLTGSDIVLYEATYKNEISKIDVVIDEIKPEVKDVVSSTVKSDEPDWYYDYAQKRAAIAESYSHSILNMSEKDVVDSNSNLLTELDGADFTLTLKNYKIFPKMEDVVRELLKVVEYRKVKGNDDLWIYTGKKRYENPGSPLIVIDGYMTRDIKYFMDIPPIKVEYIKVINTNSKLVRLGKLASHGIIIVKTKGFENFSDDSHFNITGLNKIINSKQHDILSIPSFVPFLKSNLYWNPNIEFNNSNESTFSFNAADDNGFYKLQVVSTKYGTCSKEIMFEVKPY